MYLERSKILFFMPRIPDVFVNTQTGQTVTKKETLTQVSIETPLEQNVYIHISLQYK
jgi:hypothetical protein